MADKAVMHPAADVVSRENLVRLWCLGRPILLVLPMLLFLVVVYALPLMGILLYAVSNREIDRNLHRTGLVLREWDGRASLPDEAIDTFVEDLKAAKADGQLPQLAVRLNEEVAGFSSLLRKTGRFVDEIRPGSARLQLSAIDARWNDGKYWQALRATSGIVTARYLLATLDLRRSWDGKIVPVEADQAVYVESFVRTFWIAGVVTVICLLVGYPLAFVVSHSSGRKGRILLALITLPLWTSVLTRTAAWVILLQQNGIVNDLLMAMRIIDQPLQMIFNREGVYIGMVHILLPFMTLPLYSAMKAIPPTQLRAASSLGARPAAAFFSIYLPQTMPGVASGCLLVFIIGIGFYITPALIGGASDQMVSAQISRFALQTANWGMASALALALVLCMALLLICFGRFLRFDGGVGR